MWGSCLKFRPAWVSHRCRLRPLHTITAVLARCEAVPGELIRWQVLDQCNIVTFSSPDRPRLQFPLLECHTDLKGIRAGRHFRSG
jgi:hypothetical protein